MSKDARRRLHLGLTRKRELLGTPYLDNPDLLEAYQEIFSPKSYAKARAVLREVCSLGFKPRRIVDLGAGPGAMARAAHDLFAEATVIACDRSQAALAAVPQGIERVIWDLARDKGPPQGLGPADIVLLGNVLSELAIDHARLLERILREVLDPQGLLIVIEPALRESSRQLERARDQLLGRGFFVVAPCLYRGGCPALERERDWCHEDRSRDGSLRFSYLVMRREGVWSDDERLYRIVSDRLVEKGREKFFGCGPAGRHLLVRLGRDKTSTNHAWDELNRGDVVELQGLERKGDGLRVNAQTKIEVTEPVVR